MLKYNITAVDDFTFGEVTYQQVLKFSDYETLVKIMETKATVILDKLKCGTVSKGRIIKIEKAVVSGVRVQTQVGGLWYGSRRFESEADANTFMSENPEWGVIKVYDTTVWVSHKNDKGKETARICGVEV